MTNEVAVVIPSWKRAGRVDALKPFPGARLVVCESQRDEYAKAHGAKKLIVIPDKHDGAIARKRNWILRNVERPVLMVDDDVSSIVMCEGGEYFRQNGRAQQQIALSAADVERMVINGFNMAHDLGVVLWGINVNEDGRNYQQYTPFSLTGMILGPFTGHLDHAFTYDEKMGTKEDYDFALQVLNGTRKILRFNKYAYMCEHADNPGGIVSQRTRGGEIAHARAIMRKWGSKIIKYDLTAKNPTKLLNGRVSVPIRGV